MATADAPNLPSVLLGRDHPAASPVGAALFVTRRARAAFDPPPGVKVAPVRRVFAGIGRTLPRYLW